MIESGDSGQKKNMHCDVIHTYVYRRIVRSSCPRDDSVTERLSDSSRMCDLRVFELCIPVILRRHELSRMKLDLRQVLQSEVDMPDHNSPAVSDSSQGCVNLWFFCALVMGWSTWPTL